VRGVRRSPPEEACSPFTWPSFSGMRKQFAVTFAVTETAEGGIPGAEGELVFGEPSENRDGIVGGGEVAGNARETYNERFAPWWMRMAAWRLVVENEAAALEQGPVRFT